MKTSNLIAFAVGAGVCAALSACGGGGHASSSSSMPAQPSPPATLVLSVSDVLGRAKVQSETADPFTVTGASVSPANDETSDPTSID